MSAKHTPGPWQPGPVFQKEGRALFVTDDSKPGRWQKRLDDKAGVFSEADARLIAAAPELLTALLKMVAAFGNCGSPRQQAAADAASAAILKATGSIDADALRRAEKLAEARLGMA